MKKRQSYIGTLDGVNGIWCDKKPEGIELKDTIVFYSADEGKVFADKEGNLLDTVVIKDGVNIEDFVEIVDVRNKEEPVEE